MTEFGATLRLVNAADGPAKFSGAAKDAELTAIAERLGLARVAEFKLDATLTRLPEGDVYRVDGEARMRADQVCVVALEPFEAAIETMFEEHLTTVPAKATGEDIEAESLDIELLEGETVDLGELALQHIAMAIDPYPRGPDADAATADSPESDADSGDDGTRRPFAGLDKLLKQAQTRE